ncbi:hypothetical protein [Gordonia malaquae]|uniref:hypothetical protein n=1 Tax=Gordonia malaquae TaxID=410332 RepID=UPI0030FE5F23
MAADARPEGCCGACPPVEVNPEHADCDACRTGYDCTCADTPGCPNYKPDDPFDTRAWIPVARQTPRTPTFFPQMKVRGGRRRHGQRSTQQANRYANGGVVWIDEVFR